MKVWNVPVSEHYPTGIKFSLFFIVSERVIIGIDNHKPKGPHIHYEKEEQSYFFTGVDKLLADFWLMIEEKGFTI